MLARFVVDLEAPSAREEVAAFALRVEELLAGYDLRQYVLLRIPRGKKTELQIIPCSTVPPSTEPNARAEVIIEPSADSMTRAVTGRPHKKVTAPVDAAGLAAGLAPGGAGAGIRRRRKPRPGQS